MMKGNSRRKGAERAVFLLIIPLFDKEEEATCVEESTCLLSFFEFPFVACCLFLLFSRFVPTTATIAFFFFFLASRSRALAYIFEKGSSLALSVAFYIAADDKGERSVNRTLNRTLKPKRNPSLYFYLFIFKKMFLVGSGGGGERNRQTENSKAQKTSTPSLSLAFLDWLRAPHLPVLFPVLPLVLPLARPIATRSRGRSAKRASAAPSAGAYLGEPSLPPSSSVPGSVSVSLSSVEFFALAFSPPLEEAAASAAAAPRPQTQA